MVGAAGSPCGVEPSPIASSANEARVRNIRVHDQLVRMPRWHRALLCCRVISALVCPSEARARYAKKLLKSVVPAAQILNGSCK